MWQEVREICSTIITCTFVAIVYQHFQIEQIYEEGPSEDKIKSFHILVGKLSEMNCATCVI